MKRSRSASAARPQCSWLLLGNAQLEPFASQIWPHIVYHALAADLTLFRVLSRVNRVAYNAAHAALARLYDAAIPRALPFVFVRPVEKCWHQLARPLAAALVCPFHSFVIVFGDVSISKLAMPAGQWSFVARAVDESYYRMLIKLDMPGGSCHWFAAPAGGMLHVTRLAALDNRTSWSTEQFRAFCAGMLCSLLARHGLLFHAGAC